MAVTKVTVTMAAKKKFKNHFHKFLFRLHLPPHNEKFMFNTIHHIHHHSALRHTGRQWRW